jgi:hypothetical protein
MAMVESETPGSRDAINARVENARLRRDLRDAENQRDEWAKLAADWQEEYRLLVEGIEAVIAQGEARTEVLRGAEGKAD